MTRINIIFICFLYLAPISYSIQVSGDVWGVWSSADNPYEVVGDLRVVPGSTLVIEPGCYIDFQGHYKFIIDTTATLQAIGTEIDSIVFTTADTAIGWLGLRFFSADSSSELYYCIIEEGKTLDSDNYPYDRGGGVFCNSCNLSISRCLIQKNKAWEGYGGKLLMAGMGNLFFLPIKFSIVILTALAITNFAFDFTGSLLLAIGGGIAVFIGGMMLSIENG